MPERARKSARVKADEQQLLLRITVLDPVPGVALALRGAGARQPVLPGGSEAQFDFVIRVKRIPGEDQPRFLGPFTHGPPAQRFVYIDVGVLAGQADSRWTRAVKVSLSAISWQLVDEALRRRTPLEARIHGRAKDGGPACASVPLLDGGWRVAASS